MASKAQQQARMAPLHAAQAERRRVEREARAAEWTAKRAKKG